VLLELIETAGSGGAASAEDRRTHGWPPTSIGARTYRIVLAHWVWDLAVGPISATVCRWFAFGWRLWRRHCRRVLVREDRVFYRRRRFALFRHNRLSPHRV